jgi:hypothetical protein
MVNSDELIGTTEYLTLYTRCHTNRRRYKRVRCIQFLPHSEPPVSITKVKWFIFFS